MKTPGTASAGRGKLMRPRVSRPRNDSRAGRRFERRRLWMGIWFISASGVVWQNQ